MGQFCSLFFANALQYASRLTANLPARYTFPSAGQILEARRTVRDEEVANNEQHRSGSRRLCGRLWLGGRLQDPKKGRLQRQHRPEPYPIVGGRRRSEEHTSELQSQSNLVCRLLLEKKKKIISPDEHM